MLIPEGQDISEFKRAEAALRQSEQRYANLAKAAPVGIFRTDADGNCLYVNDRWSQIAGMEPEQSLGTGWVEGLHPEDREMVAAEWYRTAQEKQPFRLEYRFQTSTGKVTWVFGQAVAETSSDGQVSGYIGTITDITERKQAEAALRASEARLKEAQQIAHMGSWELDLKTNILIWSDETYRIFEINPQQFGATYEAFLRAVHPDDRDLVNQAYSDSVKNRTPYDITHRLRMDDGRIKYVHERCQTFYDRGGSAIRSIGTVQDVTDQKQIEDALHYQLAQAQLGAQISTRFSNLASADLDAGIQETLQEIAEFAQMDASFMIQVSQRDPTLNITHEWLVPGLTPQRYSTQTLPFSVSPWMTSRIQSGEVICIPSIADLPAGVSIDRRYWQALGLRSLVAVPICCQHDEIVWIICASRLEQSYFESLISEQGECSFFRAIDLLKLAGEIFAHALQRRNTEAELHQHQHHLEDLVANRTAELQESETRFRMMADTAPVLIWVSDVDQRCIYFNQVWLTFTGRTMAQELDDGWAEGIHPEDLERYLETYAIAFEARHPFQMEYRLRRFDGEYRWLLDIGSPRFLPNGEFAGYIGSCVDITERKRMEQALCREKELAQVTLHSIGDAVITTDAFEQVEYVNPVAEQLTGWKATAARGQSLTEVFQIINEITRKPVPNPVERVLREGCATGLANHTVLISRQGVEYSIEDSAAPIRDRQGQIIGAVIVFHDVTQSRQLANQLSWQASHDALTGLVNRRQFEQELAETLQHVQQENQIHVLCYLDLDQFKVVNDTCGHIAGDELLRQVSRLLRGGIRSIDTLARLGGDEFGILLKRCPLKRAEIIADQLRKAIQNFRFLWQDRTFSIGVSIGIVSLDADNCILDEVLSAADAACYAAKDRGRNRFHVYQVDDSELVRQRGERQWSVFIKQALEDNRFCLYRQAIVRTTQSNDTQHIHYEILLRMIDEQGSLILPGAFIPAAERYDLMLDIDCWVVRTFLAHLERSRQLRLTTDEMGIDTLHLINLSGASVGDAQFLSFLKEQFARYAVSPQAIGFEITETAAIANLDQATHLIRELKQLGCHFALDDFGSGMSSFGYLKTLPVDYLKIDGKFIGDIVGDPATHAIVESINHVGHVMGLKTIAESVESLALRGQLDKIGVDYVQGYGIARPCPIVLS